MSLLPTKMNKQKTHKQFCMLCWQSSLPHTPISTERSFPSRSALKTSKIKPYRSTVGTLMERSRKMAGHGRCLLSVLPCAHSRAWQMLLMLECLAQAKADKSISERLQKSCCPVFLPALSYLIHQKLKTGLHRCGSKLTGRMHVQQSIWCAIEDALPPVVSPTSHECIGLTACVRVLQC